MLCLPKTGVAEKKLVAVSKEKLSLNYHVNAEIRIPAFTSLFRNLRFTQSKQH